MKTKMLILSALFAAVTAVFSQILIPIGPVPINLGTLAVFLAGGFLGHKYGTLSIGVYILLGVVGVPVFAGFKGGAAAITGPTGGYIIGYLFIAFIVGLAVSKSEKVSLIILISAMIIGLAICYILGTTWFIHLTGWTLKKALMTCVVVFLPGDALKIFLATVMVKKLKPRLEKIS